MKGPTALRGRLAYCVDDPFLTEPARALVFEHDGVVVCRDGLIEYAGPWSDMVDRLPGDVHVADYRDCIIMPGFIDAHVHYVQTSIIGSRAAGLLDWLERAAYPAERAFAQKAHAAAVARTFCDALLRSGTTSAMVFCSVHAASVEALFEEAARRGMRMIAGKVLMDRNVPDDLRDGPDRGYAESRALLSAWHGRGRLSYAITPRFAASCSDPQLDAAATLWREFPDAYVQTHISESKGEVAWVRELFPQRKSYFDVYEHHGLAGRRALYAHGVHLTEPELWRMHDTGTALAHCPTSNLFLGSGLFRLHAAKDRRRPVHVALGTDVGAGTTFSMLQTLNEAYKVAALSGRVMTVEEAFFLATLGGARALGLDHRVGSLRPGMEADLVVLDPHATPLMAELDARSDSIRDTLFLLMTVGDDRAVRATWVAGARA